MNPNQVIFQLVITKITVDFLSIFFFFLFFLSETMSLGFTHFSKKNGVLAARLVTRNFTRGLGYAKPPLPMAHASADARLRRRRPPQTHAPADAGL